MNARLFPRRLPFHLDIPETSRLYQSDVSGMSRWNGRRRGKNRALMIKTRRAKP